MQQKQNYLIQEIINQGYNQDAFAEYLNQKGKGLDVTLYTWDELIYFVQEFKRL